MVAAGALVSAVLCAGITTVSALPITVVVDPSSIAGSGQPTSLQPGAWYARYEAGVAWTATTNLTDGAIGFVDGPTGPPLGAGSLALTTTEPLVAGGTAIGGKATLFNYDWIGTRLADIQSVGFWTNTTVSPVTASFQMEIWRTGTSMFSTVNVERYRTAVPVNGVWEHTTAGVGYATTRVWLTGFSIGAGSQGSPISWDQMMAIFPNAVVAGGVGFNLGRGPTVGTTYADALTITLNNGDATTYDFENQIVLANKDECKNGGWQRSTAPVFANQGHCVSHFAAEGKARPKS